MTVFTSIRTSSWDVDALVNKLNEHATQGWTLVTVVNTGGDLAAILSRGEPASGAAPVAVEAPAAAEPAPAAAIVESVPVAVEPEPVVVAPSTPEPEPEPEPAPVAVTEPEPVVEPAGWAAAPVEAAPVVIEAAVVEVPAAKPEPEPVVATQPAASVAVTPAGWYPDPSGRYEMRYWDGVAWTEHVARGGQQYTDPPVA